MKYIETVKKEDYLFTMKIGVRPEQQGFYQMFFIDGHNLENVVPLMIGYSNDGIPDISHFPKEDIITIANA